MKITYNSYFSGVGLFDLGLQSGGLNVGQSFEIDSECCSVQEENFGHKVNRCDITQKKVLDDSDCDVMVGTYPCTKYSSIADIHGTRTGDELFLHFFRHIAIKKPEVYAIENVPGMKKFPVVMEAMTKLPDYYVSVFCPVKAENWLPQRRDRLIIIGSKKSFNWQSPEKGNRIPLSDIIERDPQVSIPDYVKARLSGKYRDMPIISDPEKGDLAPTCVAHYAKDRGTRLVMDNGIPRPYTVREYARLQGVPDWFQFNCSDNSAYRMIGNGVAVPVGIWLGKEIMRYFVN